jgi:LPS O-antigen subunit length determinant protein (WzzB/FepE family)
MELKDTAALQQLHLRTEARSNCADTALVSAAAAAAVAVCLLFLAPATATSTATVQHML